MARSAPALLILLAASCVNDPKAPFTAEEVGAYCDSFDAFATAKAGGCGYGATADIVVFQRYLATCRAHAGAGRLDVRRAARCLDEVERTRCPELARPVIPEECASALVGLVAVGQACGGSRDCAAGAFCRTDAGSCGGTCTAEALPAGMCLEGPWGARACAPGTVCRSTRCQTPGQPGDPCVDGTCRRDLICSSERRCVVPGAFEAPCTIDGCLDGLTCVNGQCTDGLPVGEVCGSDEECLSTLCLATTCRRAVRPDESCAGGLPCQEGTCTGAGMCAVVTSTCG